ncbi:hypothetical protein AC249_AIPGENE13198 [Exaiptasia diaphana]|nr:hypothetical protein AC249_AIPGENE13198 [Exaiptasia diaphana]
MIQLKVFYSIESERCQVIMAKEESLLTYEDLLAVIRQHIECFQFIPNEELRIQYLDDEGTYVNLNEQSLEDALRCAVTVSTFRRLKLKISWQPKSTPEMVAAKRRQSALIDNKLTPSNHVSSTERSSQSSRKQLNFADSRKIKRNTGIPTLCIDTLNAKCTKYLPENDNYACSKQDGGQNKRDGDFQNFHVDYSKTAASRERQQAEIHSIR